jgi:hypothetical protein
MPPKRYGIPESRPGEESQNRSRCPDGIPEVKVIGTRIIEIDGTLDEPQPEQQPAIEVEIMLRITCDGSDVMDPMDGHKTGVRSQESAERLMTAWPVGHRREWSARSQAFDPMGGSQRRNPPLKALALVPARQPGGKSFNFFTLPPPRTTSSGSRAAIKRATISST